MILLDTHVLIWLIEGDKRLGGEAVAAIEQARVDDAAYVSAITPWEIAMLFNKGRVQLSRAVAPWIRFALAAPGIKLAVLEPMIAVDAGQLPDNIHGDPADRIIMATARALACPLLTADSQIQRYARQGHLSAIDARR